MKKLMLPLLYCSNFFLMDKALADKEESATLLYEHQLIFQLGASERLKDAYRQSIIADKGTSNHAKNSSAQMISLSSYRLQTAAAAQLSLANDSQNQKEQYNQLFHGLISGNDSAANALKQGNYAKAILLYQQALIKNPNDKQALLGIEHAEILLKNYIYANQQLVIYKNKFGVDKQYLLEQARLFILTNQAQNALDLAEQILKKDPYNQLALSIKNYVLQHLKYLLIKTKNPEFAEISEENEQALQILNSGDYKKALFLFKNSFAKDSNDKFALRGIIEAMLFLEDYKNAEKNLTIYREKFGQDKYYLLNEARYFAFTRNREKALLRLKPLLENDPANMTLITIHNYALRTSQAAGLPSSSQVLTHAKSKQTSSISPVQHAKPRPEAYRLAYKAFAKGSDAALYIRAAKAYQQEKNQEAALAMVNQALKITPNNSYYLAFKAELSDDKTAYRIYKNIYAANPHNLYVILNLARKASALNQLDESAKFYSIYTHLNPSNQKAWLEYAYIQSWRGNDRQAIALMRRYESLFEPSNEYFIEKARILASATRPTEALSIANALLAGNSKNYDLYYAKTTALYYKNQPIEMFETLKKVNELAPDSQETKGLNAFIRTPYRSFVSIDYNYSFDTDTIHITKVPMLGRYFLSPLTSFLTNFTPERLTATEKSGLNPIQGGTGLNLYNYSLGLQHRFNSILDTMAWLGIANPTLGKTALLYEGDALLTLNDITQINFQLKRSYYDLSPRTVSLGILQNLNQMQILWQPCLQCYVNLNTSYSTFSDTNTMNDANLDIGANIIATQFFNIKLGTANQWQHFSKQYNHGYYNPSHYRFYNVNTGIYYKYSDNIGYELSIGNGKQKDETFRKFKPANDYTFKAYYGIYQDWYLTLSLAHSTRGRNVGNAATKPIYKITAIDATLTRRF